MPFDRNEVRRRAAELAARGVFIGTSSWKYAGWRGMLYDEANYLWHGKVAESRFERNCLTEYAEVFKTVCVDAAYYTFPSKKQIEGLISQVPEDFRFGLKVTDAITVKKFPNLDRFGERAGMANKDFLNADLFAREFLGPWESRREMVGIVMFEFSRFYQSDYATGAEFVADLDKFLGNLPKNWAYGIEMRNSHWLRPEYFATLSKHHVAHVFNSWTAMPPVAEQFDLAGSVSNPDLLAARFLLRPGRKYEEAVKAFQPYAKTQEVNQEAREAGGKMIRARLKRERPGKTYIYVNNRLEGNALETINAMMLLMEAEES